ncbi:MAG: 50S ribosomal protein L11 methyltransferase [Bacteroidota bacterium]|nr:50S ribosomal protein L11 methyltransferase [Bacteroidota bacterium]
MDYIQVDIELSEKTPYSDIITAKLNEIEFESYQQTESGLQAYIQKIHFNEELLNDALKILDNQVDFNFQVKEIKQQNWNTNWESSFSPIYINDNCVIRANFHPETDLSFELIITPKMSFGTGHHATTFLMANELFNLELKERTVLDMGSGSGLLSILSEKLGAKNTIGIDIDDWADKNAKENAILNSSKYTSFELGDVAKIGNRRFDIILANINRNIILTDMEKYVTALNSTGDLLLSGFYKEDEDLIKNKANELKLKLVKSKEKENWLLLHFKR